MALTPGSRLGPYEVLSAIGAGGMGEVYRARDSKLNRDVALKILPDAFASDPERLARFRREAQVLASLNHANIGAIHGFEDSGSTHALVLELVEGPTLADRIAQGPIPLDEVLPIARQIAEALEAAHEIGIIHRDLKPANIKLKVRGAPPPRTEDGLLERRLSAADVADCTVKVLDFGLAKALEPASATGSPATVTNSPTLTSPLGMTGVGVLLGTAAYMAPEQARGRAVDKRADIWAFGCVLYEMLTGQGAFGGEDVTVTLARVVEREPNLDALPPAVPARVRQVLRLCLRKDPKQRVSDIRDVRLALDGAFDSSVVQVVTAPLAKRTRTREYVAWILAAVATLSALGAVALYLRAPRAQDAIVRFNVLPPQGMVRRPFTQFAASPDGQFLAFVATGADGVRRVLTKRIDTAEAQLLSGTDRATSVFWAPDSRSLGLTRDGGVFRIDLDGSPPRRLCDVPGNIFTGGAWAPGVIVFGGANGLVRIPDTGGTPTPATTLDAGAKEARHIGPWFLPDGRHLLFLAVAIGQTRGVVWAASIDDPARTRITESSGTIAYAEDWLLSTTDTPRRLVAQRFDAKRLSLQGSPQPVHDRLPPPNTNGSPGFAVSSNGVLVVDRPPSFTSRLEWVDRTGRVESVLGPSGTIPSFAVAPDERRVVAQVIDQDAGKTELWLFEPGRADGTRLTYESPASRPLWSRDNRHVHFTGSGFVLRTIAVGQTAATPFEHPGPFVHFEDATRDGQYLVFKSLSRPSEIWTQRVGSKEQLALVQSPFSATRPRVSPDSRWLAYTLDLPSGTEVFAQPFNRAGDRIQVSRGGGIGPIWRDDSRELYYEGPDGLMAVEMTDRDGTLAAGTPQKLFALHTQGDTGNQPHNVEVAAHGQKFLVNSIVGDSDNVPLEVTLNWTTGLR